MKNKLNVAFILSLEFMLFGCWSAAAGELQLDRSKSGRARLIPFDQAGRVRPHSPERNVDHQNELLSLVESNRTREEADRRFKD